MRYCNQHIQARIYIEELSLIDSSCSFHYLSGDALGRVKKMWIYQHLGGWVGEDGDKIHKKNMPLKFILDHFKSF